MENEQITNTLKGISSILVSMSENTGGNILWNEHALLPLNAKLIECIRELEQNKKNPRFPEGSKQSYIIPNNDFHIVLFAVISPSCFALEYLKTIL